MSDHVDESFDSQPRDPSQTRVTSQSRIRIGRDVSSAFGAPESTYTILPLRDSAFGEIFTGVGGQNARRWLFRFHARHGLNPETGQSRAPGDWLESVNGHLEGDAAFWADKNPLVRRICHPDHLEKATPEDVVEFRRLFLERWEDEVEEATNPMNDIQNLRQEVGETLRDYYKRADSHLKLTGAAEMPASATQLQTYVNDTVIERFVRGLASRALQVRLVGYEMTVGRSLKGAYQLAESESRKMQAEKALLASEKEEKLREVMQQITQYALEGKTAPASLLVQVRELSGMPAVSSPAAVLVAPRFTNPPPAPHPIPTQQSTMMSATPINTPPSVNVQSNRSLANTNPTTVQVPFDPLSSSNPLVRGDAQIRAGRDNPVCYKCGTYGHYPNHCSNDALSLPEQAHLKAKVDEYRARAIAARAEREALNTSRVSDISQTAGVANISVKHVRFSGVSDLGDSDEDASDWGESFTPLSNEEVQVNAIGDKRRRVEIEVTEEENRMEGFEHNRPTVKPKGKGVGRKKQIPKSISGKVGKKAFDVFEMLDNTNVVMPLMDLAQLSPHIRSEIRRAITIPRAPRKKKGAAAEREDDREQTLQTEGVSQNTRRSSNLSTNQAVGATANFDRRTSVSNVNAAGDEVDDAIPIPLENVNRVVIEQSVARGILEWHDHDGMKAAFGIPAVVSATKKGKQVRMSRTRLTADQGSDINVVYPEMVARLHLKKRPISEIVRKGSKLMMVAANGTTTRLRHWVTFCINVAGIKRVVWAFVCPYKHDTLCAILGLPFLRSVNAHIHVRDATLEIGDTNVDSKVVVLSAPGKDSNSVQAKGEKDEDFDSESSEAEGEDETTDYDMTDEEDEDEEQDDETAEEGF